MEELSTPANPFARLYYNPRYLQTTNSTTQNITALMLLA